MYVPCFSEPNLVWKPFKTSWPSGYFTNEKEGLCICLWARRPRIQTHTHIPQRDGENPNEFFAGMLPCGVTLPIKFSFRFPAPVDRRSPPCHALAEQPSFGELNRGTLFRLDILRRSLLQLALFVDVPKSGKTFDVSRIKIRGCEVDLRPSNFRRLTERSRISNEKESRID